MANSDKNIVITPNISSSSDDPKVVFTGANTSGSYPITVRAYPSNNGTLSFEGSTGQLFSITNSMSGTLFSVNDVSGMPGIELLDTGILKLAQYAGNVLVGSGTDLGGTARFQISYGTPTSVGSLPSGVITTQSSTTNNYFLFRNTADNGTYSGIAFQDNNIGGYVIFGNAGGGGDSLYVAGYAGGQLQYGTTDSINPGARTTVASWNSTGLQVNNGDFRATIFYDSNNTGYYSDPASTSRLNTTQTDQSYTYGWFRNFTANQGLYNEATSNHWYSTDSAYWNLAGTNNSYCGIIFRPEGHQSTIRGYVYADTSNNIGFLGSDGNWKLRVVSNDYSLADGSSMRAQIFYDSNDSGYYCNPNSTSRLNNLYIDTINNNFTMFSGQTSALSFENQTSFFRWAFNKLAFYEWDGNGDTFIIDGGYCYSPYSFRAPIFYDSNDTGYYCDPNSTTRLNNLTVTGTVTGISGGGFTENTWINNKYFGTDGSIYATVFYDSSSSSYYADLNATGTSINVAGAIVAAGNITAYSDIRLKEDIKVIENAVDKVKQITGITYKRKETGKQHTGVIAQEVLAILPEAVEGSEESFYSVAYGNMVGLLVEAIKEQQKQIEELKSLLQSK